MNIAIDARELRRLYALNAVGVIFGALFFAVGGWIPLVLMWVPMLFYRKWILSRVRIIALLGGIWLVAIAVLAAAVSGAGLHIKIF